MSIAINAIRSVAIKVRNNNNSYLLKKGKRKEKKINKCGII
jgi:hypothetical protein